MISLFCYCYFFIFAPLLKRKINNNINDQEAAEKMQIPEGS